MIERLPTPWGLVRLGVAPDHPKLKEVSRAFERTAGSRETPGGRQPEPQTVVGPAGQATDDAHEHRRAVERVQRAQGQHRDHREPHDHIDHGQGVRQTRYQAEIVS